MKNLVSMLIVGAALQASAQSSTTTAPAAGTTTATATAAAPAKKVWGGTLATENAVNMADRRDNGNDALITSLNAVGLTYKLNTATTLELRQLFNYVSNVDKAQGRLKGLHQDSQFALNYLMARAAYTTDVKIAGSKALAVEGRYYLPTDRLSKENKELGILRADASTSWDLTPKWNLDVYASPRVLLNSKDNPNTAKGSDAEYYRLVAYPTITYAFSDSLGAYYANGVDVASSEAQRGRWSADTRNVNYQELGVNYTIGSFTINPALSTEPSMDNAQASWIGGRAFSYETTAYNLNVYATF